MIFLPFPLEAEEAVLEDHLEVVVAEAHWEVEG